MPRTVSILVLAFVMLLLAACEEEPTKIINRREAKPPPGTGASGDICVIVRNRAPFTITGRVQLKSRERASFRLSRNKSTKLCVSGQLYGANTVSFVLTNFLTVPLFSCYTRFDRSIDVYARRKGDEWAYDASCQW